MYKKSLYSVVILGALLSAACQHDPVVINSTWHKPGDSKPLPRSNSMGKENAESNSMKQENENQNMTNHSENSRSEMNAMTNKTTNTAKKP